MVRQVAQRDIELLPAVVHDRWYGAAPVRRPRRIASAFGPQHLAERSRLNGHAPADTHVHHGRRGHRELGETVRQTIESRARIDGLDSWSSLDRPLVDHTGDLFGEAVTLVDQRAYLDEPRLVDAIGYGGRRATKAACEQNAGRYCGNDESDEDGTGHLGTPLDTRTT